MTGSIFDIKRFSTHDGEGIRTTIFLKGCSLGCVWCQNPEGIDQAMKVVFFESRCIRCQECVRADRNNVVEWVNQTPVFIRTEETHLYKDIIDRCPSGAIRYDSRRYTVEEIMEVIRKDIPFYRENGGVTFSGGEPLMQWKFIDETVRSCQSEGIRTAIETTLNIAYLQIEHLLNNIDSIYVDLKLMDEEMHKKHTGVSNRLILDNIKRLLTSGIRHKVIIRTPLIPDFTATESNIRAIARFLVDSDPNVRYELLNYNPLASAKYPLIGKEYCFNGPVDPYGEEEIIGRFGRFAREEGVKNMIESHHKRG